MLYQYRQYNKGEFFVVAVDTAAGGDDCVAGQFLSKTNLDVPVVIHAEESITAVTPKIHNELERIYLETGVKPVVAYERQNGGIFELERLQRLNKFGNYTIFLMPSLGKVDNADPTMLGWDTNGASRPKACQDLQEAINNKLVKLYHEETINELFSFIIHKSGKMAAEKNAHDDLVMALAIAWQMYQICQPEQTAKKDYSKYENYKQPTVYDKRGYLI